MHSFLYKLAPTALCVLVAASLFSISAHADEAQPTSQVLVTPTVAQVQPTEAPTFEPTLEVAPPNTPTPVAATHVPPTETFRVVEAITRVSTFAPTHAPPTPVPTHAPVESTIATGPDLATATASPDLPAENATGETPTPEVSLPLGLPTVNIEGIVITGPETPAASTTPLLTYTPSGTVTGTITPTELPYWVPGPECSLEQGKVIVKLPVPYIHQVMDIGGANGNWACGPTSVTMVLAYYGKLAPWQDYLARQAASLTATPIFTATAISILNTTPAREVAQTSTPSAKAGLGSRQAKSRIEVPATQPKRATGLSFAPYVTEMYTNNGYTYSATARDPSGDSVAGLYGTICPNGLADWSRMAFVLQQHGLSGRHIAVTWESVVAALDRGHPVILGNDLTSVGHIILAIGYTDNGNIIVNDPYGNRFASGYGGTRGDGLFYPWSCARTRNAYEVIGVYTPPTGTAVPQVSGLPTTFGGTKNIGSAFHWGSGPQEDRPSLIVEATASPAASATQVSSKTAPVKADTSVIAPGKPLATAVISGWTVEPEQQNAFGWGLFSLLSLAAAFVGVGTFRKTRKLVAMHAVATSTPDSSMSAISPVVEALQPEGQGDMPETQPEEIAPPVVSEPAHSPIPTATPGLQLVLRRTLPVALSLCLLGLKLYRTSKGQDDARTRITDETKRLMIRNL